MVELLIVPLTAFAQRCVIEQKCVFALTFVFCVHGRSVEGLLSHEETKKPAPAQATIGWGDVARAITVLQQHQCMFSILLSKAFVFLRCSSQTCAKTHLWYTQMTQWYCGAKRAMLPLFCTSGYR